MKNVRDIKLPSEVFEELTMGNIKGFRQTGLQIPQMEMSSVAWARISKPMSYLQSSGRLQKLLGRNCYLSVQAGGRRRSNASIITEQHNKRAQLKYNNKLRSILLPGIVTLKKQVELCRTDGRRISPKFSNLRLSFRRLETSRGLPLVESVIPIVRSPDAGMVEAFYLPDKLGERERVLKNIQVDPAGWWKGYWEKVDGLTPGEWPQHH